MKIFFTTHESVVKGIDWTRREIVTCLRRHLIAVLTIVSAVSFLFLGSKIAWASEGQGWNSISLTAPLAGNWGIYSELIHRQSFESRDWVTRSLRAGLTYKFSENWTYAFIMENRRTNTSSSAEWRWIHQVQRGFDLGYVQSLLRFRWELREFADHPGFLNRARVLGRFDFKDWKLGFFYPFVSQEYFYHLNSVTSRRAGTTESRSQFGLSFPFDGWKLDLAYLDRFIQVPSTDSLPRSGTHYRIINSSISVKF